MLKLKELLKMILFHLMNLFFLIRKFNSKYDHQNILLIRLDSLGDYVLFRNFIPILRNSSKFSNHKITLLGNKKWKEIAENLDGEFIDEFIWIDDVSNTLMSLKKRFYTLNYISQRKFKYLINPTISRSFYTDDSIVKVSNSKVKIGCIGDYTNITVSQKRKSDKFYDELLKIDDEIKFEFYRNKEFFENLLGENIDLEKPFIKLPNNLSNSIIDKEYALIVPGAGHPGREWSLVNFDHVIKHLINKYNLNIYVIGSNKEKNLGDNLVMLNKVNKIHNLAGKTNSLELTKIIKDSKIMISNETGPLHIAALLGTKSVCIPNGNLLFRFYPYPEEISSSIKYVYPELIRNKINSKENLGGFWKATSLNIDQVSKEEVIREIDNILINDLLENK